MIKILILLSLTTVGCRHTPTTCSKTLHVCPGKGHGRHWLQRLVLLLLAVSLTACEVIPKTKCINEDPHGWGKWEITETPESYDAHIEVQRRTCVICGYTERKSNSPTN
jgi:hypothetical protein